MFQYFKKYTIYVAAVAIALPVIASTIWPLFTGQIMAASLSGLFLLFALFICGLAIGYKIFGGKADALVEGWLAKYNEDCDPQALVDEGQSLAANITYPCNSSGAWFLGYFGQALLDLGRVDEARHIEQGLRLSIDSAKKPTEKVGILVNLLPLEKKLDGNEAAINLIYEGQKYCSEAGPSVSQEKEFLDIQKSILEARMGDEYEKIYDLDEKIRSSAQYPMRIRVEYAWDEASAAYKLGNKAEEKDALQYVSMHGGKLALVKKAKERLNSL